LNLLGEHDYEPFPGLPSALPEGEYVCWQGRPDWKDLAISTFQVRKLAFYFSMLLALRVIFNLNGGFVTAEVLLSTAMLGGLAVVAIGLLCMMAWLMARATIYTITSQRIVIRSGVALPMTVNLPFARVVSADLRQRSGGFGDIPLTLTADSQASWIVLWPHVKFWRWGGVQPMLRAMANSQVVAGKLRDALLEFSQADPDSTTRAARVVSADEKQSMAPGSTLHSAH